MSQESQDDAISIMEENEERRNEGVNWPDKMQLESRKGAHGGPCFYERSRHRHTPIYAGQELEPYVRLKTLNGPERQIEALRALVRSEASYLRDMNPNPKQIAGRIEAEMERILDTAKEDEVTVPCTCRGDFRSADPDKHEKSCAIHHRLLYCPECGEGEGKHHFGCSHLTGPETPSEARTNRPGVGVGIVVWHEGYVLLGRRKGSHGAGELSLPGGRVEANEDPKMAAEREIKEETGMNGGNYVQIPFWSFDCYEEADRDYLTLYYAVRWGHKNPVVMEPDKCESWDWYHWKDISKDPEELFAGLCDLIDHHPNLGQGKL